MAGNGGLCIGKKKKTQSQLSTKKKKKMQGPLWLFPKWKRETEMGGEGKEKNCWLMDGTEAAQCWQWLKSDSKPMERV